MKILDIESNKLIEVEIVIADKFEMPSKNSSWNFNWQEIISEPNANTYVLRIKDGDNAIEGLMNLIVSQGMQVMDILEIAPHNIGNKKKYDYVAGCLIAFACRESFQIEGEYKGYLTFVSKTKLIDWYISKYGAEQVFGQNMFIEPNTGLKLIDKYLSNKGEYHERK